MAKEKETAPAPERPRWLLPAHIAFVAALLAGIQIAVSGGFVNRIFLASPTQIWAELLYMLERDILFTHLVITLQEFLVGYAISIAGGIIVGILFVFFPPVEQFFSPIMSAIMAVPKTAVMPLLIVWFGIGFKSKVVLVILFCFFNILFNTVTGAKQTGTGYLKVARVFCASRSQTLFKVVLPSALPSIFNGLRITAATGITGVIFSEMTAAKKGLGFLLSESQAVLNTPRLFLVILIVTALSVFLVACVNLIERIVCRRYRTI